MLNSVIDFEFFNDFCSKAPQTYSGESHEKLWISMMDFLKSGSNVTITNYSDQHSIFLTQLTTGRNGTNIQTQPQFRKPHKFQFPKDYNIQTVFFLNEKDCDNQKIYREKNGFFFAFPDNYQEHWKDFSFHENSVLHDRKSVPDHKKFTWKTFAAHLPPFTDAIIRDSFLFLNRNEIKAKLGNLIESFNAATPVRYNLLIIFDKSKMDSSFEDSLENLGDHLLNEKIIDSRKTNLGLVHTRREHDRFLFFNYLEVDFGKIPDGSANPTKITFFPYINRNNYENAECVLNDFKDILENAKKSNETIGNLKNRLLN